MIIGIFQSFWNKIVSCNSYCYSDSREQLNFKIFSKYCGKLSDLLEKYLATIYFWNMIDDSCDMELSDFKIFEFQLCWISLKTCIQPTIIFQKITKQLFISWIRRTIAITGNNLISKWLKYTNYHILKYFEIR
jgi:hypothetical protein